MLKRAIILLVLAVFCIAGLTGCAAREAEESAAELAEPAGVKVDTAAAYIGEIYTVDLEEGVVAAYVEELSFTVDGEVLDIPGYAGKAVEEGEALIQMDFTAEEQRAEELRASLAYDEQDNAYADRLAEIEIEAMQNQLWQLYDSGADWAATYPVQLQIETMQASLRQTQELRQIDIDARKQELAELEAAIAGGTLTAPFAGRVIYCAVQPGDWLSAYKPAVYLADQSRLTLYTTHLSDSTIKNTHRFYAVIGDKTYDLTPRPEDQDEYLAKVFAGEELRTYYDFVDADGVPPELEAGQYAQVCLVSGYVADALLVPRAALHSDAGGGRYVYVDEDGVQVRRDVTIGVMTQALVQITGGLEEGEVVYVKS